MEQHRLFDITTMFVVGLLLAGASLVAQVPEPEVRAEPVPGQLDVMQGTAVKLGGAAPAEGPVPLSYRWEIVQGEGGELYHEDQAEAIFQAPVISADLEVFVVRLTVEYPGGQRASNSVHLRVHRNEPVAAREAAEESIEDVMAEYYRREAEAREKNRRKNDSGPTVIYHGFRGYHGGIGYSGPGWGWGYGWGWPARYPIYAPVVVPPPGIHWSPGVGRWDDPVAIPYDDLRSVFPEDIADDYAPGDYPAGDAEVGRSEEGSDPADFIIMPPGTARGGDEEAGGELEDSTGS
ncbi:MAG: hypothetical protein V2I67_05275 [Thermoanaerobaculales bacterium]|nr:hypothetical protein [Thermoanaerobaculales bacterium]